MRRSHRPSHRGVEGVRWASLVERPECIPLPKSSRGAKAAGLRYEKLFARQFSQALHGQWFEYEDKFGYGYCQPDLIASFLPDCLVVFEVKYTLTNEAFFQLTSLYLPVVQAAMSAPVVGCIVAKNLTSGLAPAFFITSSLDAAVERASRAIPVLHWVGQPLSPSHHQHPLKFKPPIPHQLAYPARVYA